MLGGVMANSADVEAEQSVEASVSGSHALRGNSIGRLPPIHEAAPHRLRCQGRAWQRGSLTYLG